MKKRTIFRSNKSIASALSRWILKLAGWQLEMAPIRLSKYVLIGAPHTSNWDFVIGYLIMTALGFRLNWVGKHTLFRKPWGWFLQWLGGIPVNRTTSRNFVEQVVASFQSHDQLILAIAPEGTRKSTNHWKSGFYHIARQADVPVLLGYIDYQKKTGGIKDILEISGDLESDLAVIRKIYHSVHGKYPENAGDISFRSHSNGPADAGPE